MEKTKYKWTPQAKFLAERAKFTKDDILECEKYVEETLFVIGGTHVHDWLNSKFKPNHK